MTVYSCGLRRIEACRLKVADIDSQRMMIRITQGKGGVDRGVPLSPTLLQTLRQYWRCMRPQTWLFPGTENGWRADKPITAKAGPEPEFPIIFSRHGSQDLAAWTATRQPWPVRRTSESWCTGPWPARSKRASCLGRVQGHRSGTP